MSPVRLLVPILLIALSLLWSLGQSQPPPLKLPLPLSLGLVAGALLLERRSLYFPAGGRWSAAWALWLPLWLALQEAKFLWWLALALGLYWSQGSKTAASLKLPPSDSFKEALSSGAASAGAVLLWELLSLKVAAPLQAGSLLFIALAYSAGGWFWTLWLHPLPDSQLFWRQQRLALLSLGLGGWGSAFILLYPAQPLTSMALLLAGVAALELGAQNLYERQEQMRASLLEKRLAKVQAKATRSELRSNDLYRQLESQKRQANLLQVLGAYWDQPQRAGLGADLPGSLALIAKSLELQEVVIFLPQALGFRPHSFFAPHAERRPKWALTPQNHPLLAQVHSQRSPLQVESAPQEWQLAAPIPQGGVLWARRLGSALPEQSLALWSRLAQEVSLPLRLGERLQSQEQSLRQLRGRHRALRRWAKKLVQLCRQLSHAGTLDNLPGFSRRLTKFLRAAFPARQVWWLKSPPPSAPLTPLAASLEGLRRAVIKNSQPLLLDDLSRSRFQGPPPLDRGSLLALPFPWPEVQGGAEVSLEGVLILSHPQAARFTRQEQELLLLILDYLRTSLHNCQLHHQLQESRAQLIQTGKLAALGQLAPSLAHELNTPLGAIRLALDSLARESSYEGGGALRLKRAQEATLQAQAIIKNLLFYTRDEARQLGPTDLRHTLRDTLQLVGHHLKRHQVQVSLKLEKLPLYLLQKSQLQQVFTNLLLNSCEALSLQPAPRRVEIAASQRQEELCLRFLDNGPGVPSPLQGRIFEPFFTTKAHGLGSGLGLAVSRSIIKGLGGSLDFTSRPGQTIFTIRLTPRLA